MDEHLQHFVRLHRCSRVSGGQQTREAQERGNCSTEKEKNISCGNVLMPRCKEPHSFYGFLEEGQGVGRSL